MGLSCYTDGDVRRIPFILGVRKKVQFSLKFTPVIKQSEKVYNCTLD